MSILTALNQLDLTTLTKQELVHKQLMTKKEIIGMSRLHVDNIDILYTTKGLYANKFFGIPTEGRWNYEITGLYFGTSTILVSLYENKNINLSWCAKDLSTGKLVYLPYWHGRPLIWQLAPIKSS